MLKIRDYSANHVYWSRPGPGHLLNKWYREPTHDSKQETNFIVYKVIKYRKKIIKYNAYFKKTVFHSHENIKKAVFHSRENISCISQVKLDVLCFLHWLP